MRRQVSVVYHSGTGGTRLVAEALGDLLAAKHPVRVSSVHDRRSAAAARRSDLLVLCYPTYYLKPSRSMREYLQRQDPGDLPRSVYIVTTYELYSENSIRACALVLRGHGAGLVGFRAIRAPGADLTCLFPRWACPWLFRFERGLATKLRSIALEIDASLENGLAARRIPWPKWYTPFSQPLQVLFDRFDRWRERVRILPERCTRCGTCVTECDREAWVSTQGVPRHDPERCELCCRCIHRCPRRAIVLVAPLKDNARLDRRLFTELGENLRRELAAP